MFRDGPEVQQDAGAESTRGDVAGGGGGVRPEGLPAPAATPLTNRGWFSAGNLTGDPEKGIEFHVDYLRITAFCDLERALEVVAAGLIEPAGIEAGWIDRGAGSRWGKIVLGNGPVEVLEPKPSTSGRAYVCVEVKGEGCTFFGDEGLRGLLSYLTAQGIEWRGKRVDPCWDHVKFDPPTVYAAVAGGNLNSRCFDSEGRDFWVNAEGQTCYVRKLKGEKTQMMRVYDRRGFNRCEFQFQGPWAELLGATLADHDVLEWSRESLKMVRASVDFVDIKSNQQPCRCTLLPWWASFVGEVEKERIPLPGKKTPRKLHPVGRSESIIMRSARKLRAIGRAFGWAYVCDRIEHHGAKSYGPDDEEFERELRPFIASGLAGLSGEADPEDDVPI